MVAEGAHVLDAGQVGTEMLYFLVGSRELDGGLMCTASHNPKAYTGAKLVQRGRDRAVRRRGHPGHPPRSSRRAWASAAGARGLGRGGRRLRRLPGGRAAVHRPRRTSRPMKVVVDGGNGMAGPMVGPLLERPAARPRRDLLGRRTASSPTTSPTRCCPRTASSSSTRCARRAPTSASPGTATPTAASSSTTPGAFVDGDFLTALLAEHLLAKQPGAAILYDVRASRAVPRHGRARPAARRFLNRVGHAFFKTRMRDEGAIFGGEVSGHYYFRDFYNADSGTIPALLILELLSVEGKPHVASCSSPTARRYFISGEINSEVADQHGEDGRDRGALRRRAAGSPTSTASRVDYDDWHFNVRPSNTEPLLRLCLESLVSAEDMERRRDEVLALIRS